MKLPSFHEVVNQAGLTFRRFPAAVIDVVVGTAVALVLADHEGPSEPSVLFRVLFGTILGIPLLISVVLFAEKKNWKRSSSLALQGGAVVLLVAYALSVPLDLADAPSHHLIRLLTLVIALQLVVAVVPFVRKGETNGFWHYNETLFLRVFTGVLYTGILFAGLSLALAALDHLFGMDVPSKRYGELWIFLVGIFTTMFFFSGIPDDWEGLERSEEYPKGLKVFAQYILLPLTLVYLVILYAYLGKILLDWDWPKGWVGRIILGFSATGILSLLLLHPIRDRVENVWVRRTTQWFYVALIPLIVMLFLALSRRLSEYGITESRYVGFVCGIWLAVISTYFIAGKSKSIKFVPASLGLTALLISFGPWGMFGFSEKSQVDRLQKILEANNILTDGSVRKASGKISFEDSKQISSILQYLHEVHGYESIQPWFGERLTKDSGAAGSWYKSPSDVAALMGVEYYSMWYGGSEGVLTLNADLASPLEIGEYDQLVRGRNIYGPSAPEIITGDRVKLRTSSELDSLTIIVAGNGNANDSITINLIPFATELLKDFGSGSMNKIDPGRLTLVDSNDVMKTKLCFQRIQIRKAEDRVKVTSFEVDVMYKLRR